MCGIGKTMSDVELMMDDIVRRAEESIRLYNDNNKYARFVRAAYESKFGKPKEKDIMEEKKTKKMTKAEAFEWLKCKKVDASYDECSVQSKLFSLGVVWWSTLNTNPCPSVKYLLIDKECRMSHCGCDLDYYKSHCYEEISAEDILSIEIVEEKQCSEEDALDLISTVGARLSEVLRRMKGHKHVVITEDDVILYDEGMSLFHSDPF